MLTIVILETLLPGGERNCALTEDSGWERAAGRWSVRAPIGGTVFQNYTAFENRTVLENIAFGLERRGVAVEKRRAAAREWIGKVGLSIEKDAAPLSGPISRVPSRPAAESPRDRQR